MSDHGKYDRERERRKLEEQRKQALRQAKTDKDREALNAFYDNRARADKRRGGKPDACAVLLLGMLTGVAGAAYGVAEVVKWMV